MSILEAIVLGVVQGLTEFLPVSSSGHLQIAKEVLGIELVDNLTFDMTLHLATVLATITVLWRETTGLLKGLFRFRCNPETAYVLKLLLSAVPIAVVGFVFRDRLNQMLSSPHVLLVVGAMLLLTAALLLMAGRAKEKEKAKSDISYTDAFVIGIGQAAAAMPGLSRSGTTISTGLLLGNRKALVARFSFLMVIVPILGETLLDALGGNFAGGAGIGTLPLAAGFVSAFAVGCAACRFMIEMVKRSRLVWFALYCAVVGVATVIYYFA